MNYLNYLKTERIFIMNKNEFENLQKNEFVRQVAVMSKEFGLDKGLTLSQANSVVDTVWAVIKENLLSGKSINIAGVGKMTAFVKKERDALSLEKNEDGTLKRDANGELLKNHYPARLGVKLSLFPRFKKEVKEIVIE